MRVLVRVAMDLAAVGRSARRLWSLWRHAMPLAIAGVVSVACYVVGLHLSDEANPGPLVHAGALATAISVAATLYDYKAALKAGEDEAAAMFARVTGELPLTGRQSQARVEGMLRGNTRRADKTITVAQVALLFVATLVWGFADVAPAWMPWAFRSAHAAPPVCGCGARPTTAHS